jgi:hypothetical protein
MPTVEIILRDDDGHMIDSQSVKKYPLDWKGRSFHDIEGAVEQFKRSALPDIEADLLEAAQKAFIEGKKKDLICNGTTPITLKTLHGRFEFKVQRLTDRMSPNQPDQTYFDLTDQFQEDYVSDRLKEFSAYYSNRLSYMEVVGLVDRVTGTQQLSDQKIRQLVVNKALSMSQALQTEVDDPLKKETRSFPKIAEKVDIYDGGSREVLVFEDAIQVRGQKDNRQHKQGVEQKLTDRDAEKTKTPAIQTDIVILEKKDGGFEYITAPINDRGHEAIPLPALVKSRVIQE